MNQTKNALILPAEDVPGFIPDDAIAWSEQGRHPVPAQAQPAIPAPDQYAEERVASNVPTPEQVKIGSPDTTVEGG